MPLVADNPVVLVWFVKRQSTAYSDRMLARVAREAVHVPIVWALEFANALRQLERRRKLGPETASSMLDAVDALGFLVEAAPPGQRRLLDLARQYDQSVHDASYGGRSRG